MTAEFVAHRGKKFIGDLSMDQMSKEIDPYLKEG